MVNQVMDVSVGVSLNQIVKNNPNLAPAKGVTMAMILNLRPATSRAKIVIQPKVHAHGVLREG
ncbi:MAG: hypothetical protein PHG63_02165 [Candidatus Dojkabacteria bacterium]|nr:hypothetical protein [Candidatus Dojkabacteria bacterium]